MKNQIDPSIKKERVNVLLNLSKELWDKYTSQFIGEELDVLIEKNDKLQNNFKKSRRIAEKKLFYDLKMLKKKNLKEI